MGTSTFKNRNWAVRFLGLKFGFEKHRIHLRGRPYMDRYMVSIGIQLRFHKFWRGDDDRAPHDHMWWFVTMPFTSYVELVAVPGAKGYFENDKDYWTYESRIVKAWRFHFRPRGFKHIVVGRADMKGLTVANGNPDPFWTFVITGPKRDEWGFWRSPTKFIHNKEWRS